jgi:hypothetical protein
MMACTCVSSEIYFCAKGRALYMQAALGPQHYIAVRRTLKKKSLERRKIKKISGRLKKKSLCTVNYSLSVLIKSSCCSRKEIIKM